MASGTYFTDLKHDQTKQSNNKTTAAEVIHEKTTQGDKAILPACPWCNETLLGK
jgi:hypothetical protein